MIIITATVASDALKTLRETDQPPGTATFVADARSRATCARRRRLRCAESNRTRFAVKTPWNHVVSKSANVNRRRVSRKTTVADAHPPPRPHPSALGAIGNDRKRTPKVSQKDAIVVVYSVFGNTE